MIWWATEDWTDRDSSAAMSSAQRKPQLLGRCEASGWPFDPIWSTGILFTAAENLVSASLRRSWYHRRKQAPNGSLIFESRLREVYISLRALDLWGRSLLTESYSEVKSPLKGTPETHLRQLCLKVSMLISSCTSEFNSFLLSLSCLPCHVSLSCAAVKFKGSLLMVTQKGSIESLAFTEHFLCATNLNELLYFLTSFAIIEHYWFSIYR